MKIRYADSTVSAGRQIVVTQSEAKDSLKLKKAFCREGKNGQGDVEILLRLPELTEAQVKETADLIVTALYEGAYRFRKECFKNWRAQDIFSGRDEWASYGDRTITLVAETELSDTINTSTIAAHCMGYARSLGNLPHNYLQIPDMVRYAEALAKKYGMKCTVLSDAALTELGCGGILAVNQGSSNQAAMVLLEYGKPGKKEKTALVGKGLMFDAGGYHLKSIDSMKGMQYDMCGAANVLECMETAARTGYDGELIGVLALAENLISPAAVKMGDVIHTMSGRTVEVYNTDAEGRLVLCDALTYAQKQGAKRVVDLATLTYSCQSALGDEMVGIFSNDEAIYAEFDAAMKTAGERSWRLPLDDIYREALCWSDTADFANYAPGKGAGASMAACFLEFFIEPGTQWVHLDVVGPAVARSESSERVKGATGVCMASIRKWLLAEV